MNKCKIEWTDAEHVTISGVIDEFSSFENLFPKEKKEIWVDLSQVSRINSSGIREWIHAVLNSNVIMHLTNCSAVMVDQLSMIPKFVGANGIVDSFHCHYQCEQCGHDEKLLMRVGKDITDSKSYKLKLEEPCPNCKGALELDHDPDAYFAFLSTQAKTTSP